MSDQPDEEPDYGFNDHAIGLLVYKGNSVEWMHSKAEKYKAALGRAWDAMTEAGFPPDGKTELCDAIRQAMIDAARKSADWPPVDGRELI